MKRETQDQSRNRLPPDIERAEHEERNAIQQYDWAVGQIVDYVKSGSFVLKSPFVRELNRLAVAGIEDDAGELRTYDVEISNCDHQPPSPDQVPELLEERGCAILS